MLFVSLVVKAKFSKTSIKESQSIMKMIAGFPKIFKTFSSRTSPDTSQGMPTYKNILILNIGMCPARSLQSS